MPEVVAVKLRYNPKTLWFDAALSSYALGDHVIVETERGREIGLVVDPRLEVTDAQIKGLKSVLKPVIRALSDIDLDHIDELDAKGREAMPVFRELIAKHELDMKPVEVEYLFGGEKVVFYFSSDERIDFRDLVRELASRFHVRVDMRQIGVRDEARMLGGLSHCGEELCCTRLGGEFQPVSIRMAKEQDLPLNPVKISGACGRLMCCLRYEYEAYKDFKQRAPGKGTLIETPLGTAKVIDFDTPREIINMRLADGKALSIPLKDFECKQDEKGCMKPCCVSRETIDRCASSSILLALSALDRELGVSAEPRLQDKLQTERQAQAQPRKRRRGQGSLGGAERQGGGSQQQAAPRERASREGASREKPRPGQHSSGLRAGAPDSSGEDRSTNKQRNQRRGGSGAQRGEQGQAQGRGKARRSGQSTPNSNRPSQGTPSPNPNSNPNRPHSAAEQAPQRGSGGSLGAGRRRRRRSSGGGNGNGGSSGSAPKE
ncbi:MAG: hypothetical protein LBU48_04580 [Coriobacteriales bacterium]|jgi:cell fate regulator YaaT (PSP1 superfamily)|nr:hypothetical protein [Coriobacteriales bacterium]